MADVVPFRPPPKNGPDDPLLVEMNRLVKRAETDRNRHIARINDCYKYALPWRHKANQPMATDGLDEIFDETVASILEDFAADMLNTFTPQKNDWIQMEPVKRLDVGESRQVADDIRKLQRHIFDQMARSNLYQALQEDYLDLGVGTMCLLIQDIDATKPIHCEAIPCTDVLLTRGPFGFVDGVFRKKSYLWAEIKVLWPDADLSEIGPEPQDKQCTEIEITDGCWRNWSDRGDESYKYAVQASGRIIYRRNYSGAGSCPFIVARWSRDSTTAWGVGPTYRTLPATKTLNHIRYLDLKNYDKYTDPPFSYEDDGIANFDLGITPGMGIPRAPGSKAPESLESKAKFDVMVFERDELRSAIRRAHYQDRPEQQGKTPPTAFQWADERAERARRMGTPATNLVEELQYPIIRRFMYLLSQRGALPPVKLYSHIIQMEPVSPLLRAQEQEEVIRLDRFAEMITVRFGPQMALIMVDMVKYGHRLAELLGIDADLLRDENDIAGAIQQLMPVLQAVKAPGGQIAPPPVGAVGGPA